VALIVVDASVVIAVADRDDALHSAGVEALAGLALDTLVLPLTAYAECLVAPAGAGRLAETVERIKGLVSSIVPPAIDTAEHAAELRAAHPRLSLPDCFVLACAMELRADVVLTADHAWRSVLPSVRVLETPVRARPRSRRGARSPRTGGARP
jgi:predicted nucleic acid-binding protein